MLVSPLPVATRTELFRGDCTIAKRLRLAFQLRVEIAAFFLRGAVSGRLRLCEFEQFGVARQAVAVGVRRIAGLASDESRGEHAVPILDGKPHIVPGHLVWSSRAPGGHARFHQLRLIDNGKIDPETAGQGLLNRLGMRARQETSALDARRDVVGKRTRDRA
ncbi:hypothetical protein D9M70_531390 [compost metagenome]